MRRLGFLLAALAVTLVVVPRSRAEEASQVQIETDLTCQCGCGLTVHSCNHLSCGSAIPLKREIAAQIATGASREEILAYFESKYGEKILSSPTTRGFNLAAWTVPFVAIGLGGLLVGVVLVRWRRSSGRSTPPSAAEDSSSSPGQRARLARELEEYERRT